MRDDRGQLEPSVCWGYSSPGKWQVRLVERLSDVILLVRWFVPHALCGAFQILNCAFKQDFVSPPHVKCVSGIGTLVC